MIYASTSCIKTKYIRDSISILAQSGIKNIELSGGTDYYEGLEEDLVSLKEKYDLNYAIHSYFPPPKEHFTVNLASCNEEILGKSISHYIRALDIAELIDAKVLSIHAGLFTDVKAAELGKKINVGNINDRSKALGIFANSYSILKGECEKRDICLYLENHVLSSENYVGCGNTNFMMMTTADTMEEMRGYFEFDLLLDLAHLYISAKTLGIDYIKEVTRLKDSVKWIHISDNDGAKDLHNPLSENSDIVAALSLITNRHIDITLETKGTLDEIINSVEIVKRMLSK